MTHARPNTAHIRILMNFPDEEQSKSAKKALDIKKKIEKLLKGEKLDNYEVVLESIQKTR